MCISKHLAPRALAAVAFALVASACGDSTGPGLTGDFNASVTGGHTQSLEGDAFFGAGSVFIEPEAGFALLLLEGSALGENDDLILIAREQAGRPAVGTYQIVGDEATPTPDQFFALWFPATGEEINGNFVSTGGSLTVTTSSSRRMRGTFEFDASGTFDTDPENVIDVTVTGSFDAVFVDENGNPASRISDVRVRQAAGR